MVCTHGRIEGRIEATWMTFSMTSGTEGYSFTTVILVHIQGMSENISVISVQFPQTEDDMGEFDDMMTFQFFCTAAAETGGRFVTFDPIFIDYGGSDLTLYLRQIRKCTHDSLYIHGICTYETRDLHLHEGDLERQGNGEFSKELGIWAGGLGEV